MLLTRGMTDQKDPNEGEGSRTAARNYYARLRTFIRENRVAPAAQNAKDYVDRHPGDAAHDERKAKAGPRPIARRVGNLITEARTMWHRAWTRVRKEIDKRRLQHANR